MLSNAGRSFAVRQNNLICTTQPLIAKEPPVGQIGGIARLASNVEDYAACRVSASRIPARSGWFVPSCRASRLVPEPPDRGSLAEGTRPAASAAGHRHR
jgi:hypothetical protein